MDSKSFRDKWLTKESDKRILKAQYVIVSTRIRIHHSTKKNLLIANKQLYPDSDFSYALVNDGKDDATKAYFGQLRQQIPLLATFIHASIETGDDIVLLCSENEWKRMGYLSMLKKFIQEEFAYPVYDYKKFIKGKDGPYKYEEKEILKECKEIMEDEAERQYEENKLTEKGRERIHEQYKETEKSSLKKKVKKLGLYTPGMEKSEMIEILELFT